MWQGRVSAPFELSGMEHFFMGPHDHHLVNERRFLLQVGDEVTKDEPITTNPNVGGFGQADIGR